MNFSGVDLLKMQFARAVNQTFESFLDSWSLPTNVEGAPIHLSGDPFSTEVPVNAAALVG